MYIDPKAIYLILALVGLVALVILIMVLIKVYKLISNINEFVSDNKDNINKTVTTLPQTLENTKELVSNLNDISEVAMDATADLIVAKENFSGQIETLKEIISIIASLFSKK